MASTGNDYESSRAAERGRAADRGALPDRVREREWRACGFCRVAGVDEVGRGPIAGPVVAGAVILPETGCEDWIARLRDSKLLPAARREELARLIWREAAAAIGVVDARCIDEIGIAPASREAMRLAVLGLSPAPDALLLDAFALPEVQLPQEAIVKGDLRCCGIAAASIIAKVARDEIMDHLARLYPGYGFERHKGYATAAHLEALAALGPSPIHRRSFAPLRADAPA